MTMIELRLYSYSEREHEGKEEETVNGSKKEVIRGSKWVGVVMRRTYERG